MASPINFPASRWQKIEADYAAWWKGELKRPLISISLSNARDPKIPKPDIPSYGFAGFYSNDTPAEKIAALWEYELAKCDFIGDSYPYVWNNFGAGVMAAFCGATLHASVEAGTIWFESDAAEKPLSERSFAFDPSNFWMKRVADIQKAAFDRMGTNAVIGLTDIGGSLDVISSLRTNEDLLMDLYDCPEDVKAANWRVHECWHKIFHYFANMNSVHTGYACWTPIFSKNPWYMLQCDFCYMIGPDMFQEFVRPELQRSCQRLSTSFYHWDGKGQLPHAKYLLSIPELTGIQWVPGSGNKPIDEWPEVYRQVRDAGKLIQIWGTFQQFERIVSDLGSAEGIICITSVDASRRREAEELIAKYQ